MEEKWQDPRLVEARRELHRCYQALDGCLNSAMKQRALEAIAKMRDALYSLSHALDEIHR
jgi:hypothetical protein